MMGFGMPAMSARGAVVPEDAHTHAVPEVRAAGKRVGHVRVRLAPVVLRFVDVLRDGTDAAAHRVRALPEVHVAAELRGCHPAVFR